jgi:GNAT superfamily N-acetyltransferase
VNIRRATAEDAEVMADLRRDMQGELTDSTGPLDPDALYERNLAYFRECIPSGQFVAYVAEEDGEMVATSGMVVYRAPPTGGNPTGIEVYIMNMYTVPSHRGRGLATKLLDALVTHAQGLGARRAWLRASDAGRPVYQRYGFVGNDAHYMLYPFPAD